ncbi:hypothetical protein A9K55_004553 [Cordyceps militaris]|uniref:Uncharacterized protein n=1 Tax=Cordyceps militaris TaxID=73501 RepID=A0A2H4SPJ8_CORMI|nr:hypothetical protein A9K55_004553 [Cordyceps militaris]
MLHCNLGGSIAASATPSSSVSLKQIYLEARLLVLLRLTRRQKTNKRKTDECPLSITEPYLRLARVASQGQPGWACRCIAIHMGKLIIATRAQGPIFPEAKMRYGAR